MDNKKKKRVAFLMPVYPPHFKYARKFLKSFERHRLNKQADFYFVFSNEEDKKAYKNNKYGSIVLPDNLKDMGKEQGIINVKKFYGIYQIKDKYDYIIVSDCESLIIKHVDLYKICETYFNNKTLWGVAVNMQTVTPKFTKLSKEFFEEKDKINELELDYWFNNPCIYKTSTIDDFFEKVNLKENITKLSFWHFDYYMYMHYLNLYHGFKPKNIIDIYCAFTKKTSTINVDFMTKYANMATEQKYDEVKRLVGNNNNIFMYIHLDRAIPITGGGCRLKAIS